MKRSTNMVECKPIVPVTIDSLEKRLVFVKLTMEWFHHHGVDVGKMEKNLCILDSTISRLKESEGAITSLTKGEHERRKREAWEMLSRFSSMVIHQRALLQVAFELVGDIDKFDVDTMEVASRVKEIEEEEDEEDSDEEDEDKTEVCSRYVSPFWGELESMFPPIQLSLGQLKKEGMDTRIYRESFGILTYTIWRFEREEMKAKAEVMGARHKEAKDRLGALLDRLDGFLAGLIRPWKEHLQLMEELVNFDRVNYHVVRTLVIEGKRPRDVVSLVEEEEDYPCENDALSRIDV